MNQKSTGTSEFQSTNLFILIWKWKLHIAIICIIAAIASMVFSGPSFIKPRYKSTVVMYPPVTNSISGILLVEDHVKGFDATQFGEDEKTEQLLQMLNSRELKKRVIEHFDLMGHYGIDSSTKYMLAKLYGSYDDNVKISRTEFMAVEIEVMDVDPVLAANIANGIVKILDTLKSDIQKQRVKVAYDIIEREYFALQKQIKVYEDSLKKLHAVGITEINSQTERLTEQYGIAVRQGNTRAINALKKELDVIEQYGAEYDRVKSVLWKERNQFYIIKRRYEQAKTDMESIMPASYVVEHAEIADKKSYPVRWLIVAIATISAIVLSLFTIAATEYFKRIKDNLKNA